MYSLFLLSLLAPSLVSTAALQRRKEVGESIWDNPEKPKSGSKITRVAVSDKTVNWGATPPWNALDSLGQHCNELSCEHQWDVSTQFVDHVEKQKGTITIYPVDAIIDDKVKKGLIEVLKHTMSQVYTKNQTDYISNPCYGTACQTTPQKHQKMDQYWAPKSIQIRVAKDDADQTPLYNLNIDTTITRKDELGGACKAIKGMAGVGGSIAGAVNGWLGVPFALSTLLCIATGN